MFWKLVVHIKSFALYATLQTIHFILFLCTSQVFGVLYSNTVLLSQRCVPMKPVCSHPIGRDTTSSTCGSGFDSRIIL